MNLIHTNHNISRPFLLSGCHHPTWPIIIKCSTEIEVQDLAIVQNAIEGGIGFHSSDVDTARFVYESDIIRGILKDGKPFYPIYYAGDNTRIILRLW